MARPAEQETPAIVVINPDEDCSASACRVILDEVLSQPADAWIESVDAAVVLDEVRRRKG
jgi:hypothetical protein